MRRFYLPEIDSEAGVAVLEGTEHHHARNVLRLEPGEEVSVLDGRGREFVCRIDSEGGRVRSHDVRPAHVSAVRA